MGEQAISERERLGHFLDQQRRAVLAIIDGLDETQLHRPVLPSGWTPIGLVRHLASAEAFWFQGVVCGEQPRMTWADDVAEPDHEPGAPFTTPHAGAAVVEQYRRQAEVSARILASRDLDAPLLGAVDFDWPGEPISDVRWVALHLIEETARHAGHLDAVRELLDGVTGLGAR